MKGLLFASFGTTHLEAKEKQIDGLARMLAEALPDYKLYQAYTSNMVRRGLEKKGVMMPDIPQALEQMAAEGITEVVIQPGLLLCGDEYEKLKRLTAEKTDLFTSVKIGKPLLACIDDIHELAEIIAAAYPKVDKQSVVFMGHGTPQLANTVYTALDYRFKDIGREDIFVGTVEAYPDLQTVMRAKAENGYTDVVLLPLMQVAGDHAKNDMAGDDEDSWVSQLTAVGYRVHPKLIGLGEIAAVQEMYLAHAQAAIAKEN